jgi:hypothetical protein
LNGSLLLRRPIYEENSRKEELLERVFLIEPIVKIILYPLDMRIFSFLLQPHVQRDTQQLIENKHFSIIFPLGGSKIGEGCKKVTLSPIGVYLMNFLEISRVFLGSSYYE